VFLAIAGSRTLTSSRQAVAVDGRGTAPLPPRGKRRGSEDPMPNTTTRAAVLEETSNAAPVLHVIDDEPTVQGLFQRIGALEQIEVRTYSSAGEFLCAFNQGAPGCIVVDLNLPDMSGLDLLRELAARKSAVPIVFMSGCARATEAASALKLGSIDFVEKPFTVDAILTAIHAGFTADAERRRAECSHKDVLARFAGLTPRELQVMELVVAGLPNKTVARRLGVSAKTVEVHRANVMRKTRAGSLAELVKMTVAAQHG
jgi:FixJ family two-component response regulator